LILKIKNTKWQGRRKIGDNSPIFSGENRGPKQEHKGDGRLWKLRKMGRKEQADTKQEDRKNLAKHEKDRDFHKPRLS